MRVLHLIAPGPMAGAERVVLSGVAALQRTDVDVTLSLLSDPRVSEHTAAFAHAAEQRGLTSVEELPVGGRVDPRTAWRLRRRARSVDVVHVHGFKTLVHALPALRSGLRICVTHHGDTAVDAKVRTYERIARGLYRFVDQVIAPSDASAKTLASLGVPSDRIAVIRNFITLSDPTPSQRERTELRRLVAVGRLSEEKGLDVALNAWNDLMRSGDAPELHLVGDGPARSALEAQCRSLGLCERVTFHGWVDDVRPHLRDADALLLPSRREGLPLVVLEARAAGLPVVASDVGGVGETFQHGETGLLVPAERRTALCGALRRLGRDYATFEEAARSEIPQVLREWSDDRWAAQTRALYGTLSHYRTAVWRRS